MNSQATMTTGKQETRRMEDDLIFVLCVNILGLFLIEYCNAHVFAIECLWAMINNVLTIYYFYKNRKNQ